ncbi:MAG: DNRLRE domain-containing protein [Methylococcaceae bacterium]
MKFNLKPLQAAMLLVGLSPLASQALVLPLIADTHLAVTNAGTSVAVNVNASNKALLNFDLSTLPAGITSADIAKATLVFFVKTVPAGGQLQVSPLTSTWTENATISTSPSTGLPQATSAPISKGNTYFAIDVTNLVLNWVDVPASNNGLALDPVGQTSLTFDSKEAIQTSHPAYIEIALKGPAGAVGHTGAVGSQGLQGVPGNSGSNGLNGAPGANGLNGAKGDKGSFPGGTAVGDMQYWNGTAWVMISAPSPAPTAPLMATLHFCNGIPSWADSCVAPVVPTPPPVTPPLSNATVFNIGDNGPAGGKVFYVTDAGLHGLEAAPADHSAYVQWGCYGTMLSGADGSAVGTGAANTADIVAGCAQSDTAAKIADAYVLNGYTDWYLPSIDELILLYQQKTVVGGFANTYYWSSSEEYNKAAICQNFVDGNQNIFGMYVSSGMSKDWARPVRAVRAF